MRVSLEVGDQESLQICTERVHLRAEDLAFSVNDSFGFPPEVLLERTYVSPGSNTFTNVLGTGVTNLVLFPTVAQTGFPKIIHHCGPTHHIVILVRNVIVFTLKRFASSIFALTGDSADKLGRGENVADIRFGRAGYIPMTRPPVRGREVVEDG
jgi:hypothetical protein